MLAQDSGPAVALHQEPEPKGTLACGLENGCANAALF